MVCQPPILGKHLVVLVEDGIGVQVREVMGPHGFAGAAFFSNREKPRLYAFFCPILLRSQCQVKLFQNNVTMSGQKDLHTASGQNHERFDDLIHPPGIYIDFRLVPEQDAPRQ